MSQQNETVPFIISAQYSFAADTGATGAELGLNIFLPDNAIVTYASTFISVALTSGGAATIDIGVAGDSNAFVAAATVASFSIGAVIPGIDLPAAPLHVEGLEVVIEFTTATIITGICTTTIQGYSLLTA